jgi:predicted ABC-type ATPase
VTLPQLFAAPLPEFTDALHEAGIYDPGLLKAVFVVGLGGSGKSRIAQAMFSGRGLKVINQDKHLEAIYKEEGLPLSDIGGSYSHFKKAQSLARKERDTFATQRLGLVIDSTGWDYDRIERPVRRLRALGYDVFMVVVRVSYETALSRNLVRGQAGGRLVPTSSIQQQYRGLKRSVPLYRTLFGKNNLVVIDNDAPITQGDWAQFVAPALASEGDRFLARPIRNRTGRKWIASRLGTIAPDDPVTQKAADRLLGPKAEARAVLPPDPFTS